MDSLITAAFEIRLINRCELRREIRGVTEKMLIQTLRNLERDGIVARKVYPTVPPRVEYSISELGWSLAPILDAIIDWS